MSEPDQYHLLTKANIEHEAKVLSGMLRLNSNVEDVLTLLGDDDFWGGESLLHREIYKAIKVVYRRDPAMEPINGEAVVEEIAISTNIDKWKTEYSDSGKTEVIRYLATILLDDPVGGSCRWYSLKVKEASIKRVLYFRAQNIFREITQPSMSLDEFLNETQHEISSLTTTNTHGRFVSLAQALINAQQQIDNREEGMSGVTYGLERLNFFTDGAQAESLVLVGARPSVGKTAFGVSIAKYAAEDGNVVAFFSIEQSTNELAFRLLAGETGISAMSLHRAGVRHNQEHVRSIISATERLSPLGIYFNDSATQTVRSIHAHCRRLKGQYPNFRLCVIDYAQIISPADRGMPRHEQIGEISRSLKRMARDMGIAVVVMAQLHRKQEDREYDEPKLSDFRESGSLEQDADVCIMLWRPEKPNPDHEVDVIKAKIAKQRSGPTGIMSFGFRKATMRFENLAIGGLD